MSTTPLLGARFTGVDATVRPRAVSAFLNAAAAARAMGDRALEEQLHRLAVDLGHPDTADPILAALVQTLSGATTGTEDT